MKSLVLQIGIVSSAAMAQHADLTAVTKILADRDSLAVPGCVAGAFRNGEPIFVRGAGAADVQQKRPFDGNSLFQANSVSKQFTALAAAKLIEQGKLSLDDDARKYLPELPEYEAPITVRMLMHQTSGVRDWIALTLLSGGEPPTPSRAEILRLLFQQRATNFTPGSRWAYSNGGYVLLSEIVERVAGMPFETYAARTILEPLGMNNSMFLNGALPKTATLVNGYGTPADGFELRTNSPLTSGAGGLLTTMNDLAKYERDLAGGGKIWTSAVRQIMLTPGKLSSGQPAVTNTGTGYGGGLYIGNRFGQEFVSHTGGSDGFTMIYARMPERNLAVIVSCNRMDANVNQKAQQLIGLIEGDILTTSAPSAPGAPQPQLPAPQPLQLAAPSEEIPGHVIGKYTSVELSATYQVSRPGGQLEVTILSSLAPRGGKKFLNFTRLPDGSFKSGFLELKFDPDGKGLLASGGMVKNIRFYRA